MKKILFLNAWEEFEEAMDYIKNGGDQYALNHFWCYDAFKNNEHYQVILLKYNKKSWLNRLGTSFNLENLQQQIDCIKNQKDYDAIFVPFTGHMALLAVLKKLKLFNKPIFALSVGAYTINQDNPWKKFRTALARYFYFHGIDYMMFINESIFLEHKKHPVHGNVDYARHWGVDLDFFQSYCEAQTEPPTLDYIFATGGTGRDFKTLINAFSGLDLQLRIIPKRNMGYPEGCPVIPNVIIDNSIPIGMESTGILRKQYYNALAVAIPLAKTPWFSPFGSTVLLEAMAMSKPVITTINEAYPLDVEKEKIGFNIDYGDVKGWQQAITYLMNHPDEAREMGERGRYLCKKMFNYELFSAEVIEKFNKAIF